MRAAHSTPLIADGDTGYGGLLNVDFTVRGYEQAGAQAIQLEDQEFPKKCGHTPGRRVIPLVDAVAKIKVAVAARASKDFLIVARTDARTALGLDEALRRGDAFLRAGADILFIEVTRDRRRDAAHRPHVFRRAVVGQHGRRGTYAAAFARRVAVDWLQDRDFSGRGAAAQPLPPCVRCSATFTPKVRPLAWPGEFFRFDDFSKLMGFERIWAFEREHVGDESNAS